MSCLYSPKRHALQTGDIWRDPCPCFRQIRRRVGDGARSRRRGARAVDARRTPPGLGHAHEHPHSRATPSPTRLARPEWNRLIMRLLQWADNLGRGLARLQPPPGRGRGKPPARARPRARRGPLQRPLARSSARRRASSARPSRATRRRRARPRNRSARRAPCRPAGRRARPRGETSSAISTKSSVIISIGPAGADDRRPARPASAPARASGAVVATCGARRAAASPGRPGRG